MKKNKKVNEDWFDYSGKEWLKKADLEDTPKMLFGQFLREGELCFLIGDAESGKSILGVQAGNSAAKGKQLPKQKEVFAMEAKRQRVLYFDFELSTVQFKKRYAEEVEKDVFKNDYTFNDNFRRLKLRARLDESTLAAMKRKIIESKSKFIIIDNLTTLEENIENVHAALRLMESLNELKDTYKLTILVLCHITKTGASTKPIAPKDMAGAKKLYALCDSAFAVGQSIIGENIRYVKQMKSRYGEKVYGTKNVVVCQICKPKNFTYFQFLKLGIEQEHLKVNKDDDREQRDIEIMKLHKQKLSYYKIGEKLGVSHMTVKRTVDRLK